MRALLSLWENTQKDTAARRQFILLCFVYLGAWSESHCVPDKQRREEIFQRYCSGGLFSGGASRAYTKGGRAARKTLFGLIDWCLCMWLCACMCVCVCVNGWHLTDGEESAPTSISPPVTFQRAAIYPHHFINKMDYSLYTAQSAQLVRPALGTKCIICGNKQLEWIEPPRSTSPRRHAQTTTTQTHFCVNCAQRSCHIRTRLNLF
jgi:hypothetical protein